MHWSPKPTTTPNTKSTPLGRDVPGATFFTGQAPRPTRRCEESRHRAIPGGRLSNRVSANAVGRRGRFPEGRSSSRAEKCCPSGKRSSGSVRAPEGRGWHSGAATDGRISVRVSFQRQTEGSASASGAVADPAARPVGERRACFNTFLALSLRPLRLRGSNVFLRVLPPLALHPRNRRFNLSGLRKSPELGLGEQQVAVYADFEGASRTFDQL